MLRKLRVFVDNEQIIETGGEAHGTGGKPSGSTKIDRDFARCGRRGRIVVGALERNAGSTDVGTANQFLLPLLDEIVGAATRLALRRAAIKTGKKLDPRSLIAAEFVILATSLPRPGYSAKAVLAVYRLRWQIELAFKRLKSLLHIDRLPTRSEPGSRSWLHAHLILALLCDDLSQDFLDSSP